MFSQIRWAVVENSGECNASARFPARYRPFLAMGLERLGHIVGQLGIGLDQTKKATRLVGRELVDQVMQFVVRRSRHPLSLRQKL
ncbi:hypothetical protein [Microbispora sp. NPDC046933]|uniref:hypothetical protein n=1 Tax=Microbispora sp. NPDC046933 TaxID=3155618 RepID=UPI0033EB402B